MNTEPALIHLPPGLVASSVTSVGLGSDLGSGEFEVHFALDLGQPDASQDAGSALPLADSAVAWAGAFWPAAQLTPGPAWRSDLPADGAATFDATPAADPGETGFEALVLPILPPATGVAAKASLSGEGSSGPHSAGTFRAQAPGGHSLRDLLASFPQVDASRPSSPPRETGPFAVGPPLESASPMVAPSSALMPAPVALPAGSGLAKGREVAGPLPSGSDGEPKAGPLPGLVDRNSEVSTGSIPPTGSLGQALDPRRNADLGPENASPLITESVPASDTARLALSGAGDKPGLSPVALAHKADAPVLVARPMNDAAMLVSQSDTKPGVGFQPVPVSAEAGPDRPVPAADRAVPTSPAHVTGAERLWLGARHLQAEPAGAAAGKEGMIGPPVKVVTETIVAPPDRAAIVPAIVGPGPATVPQAASSLAVLAFRQAEDPLLSAEAALGIADRLPLPLPNHATSSLLPAAPVFQAAAQIVASLTQRPDGTTEIALSPDELGSVRLQFQADSQNPDRIVVHLGFDRPETMELFRRHADQLTEAIRSAGYAEARLDFGQAGAGSGDGTRPGWAGRNDDSAGPPQESAGERTAKGAEQDGLYVLRLSGVAGMDLRL